MSRCGFGSSGHNAPWGHRLAPDGETLEPVEPGFFADNPPTLGPAGTVHCSLEDYTKFLKWNIDGLQGRPRLLSAETFKTLHTAWPGHFYSYGGWIIVQRPWANGAASTHSGSNTMNFAAAWIAPGIDKAFVGVTNAGSDGAATAVDELIAEIVSGQ
jgi:D-alanyl-D-alanine carboxypeptidase